MDEICLKINWLSWHSAEETKERGKFTVFHTGEKAEHFKPLFRYIEHNYVLKRWMNRHF